MKRQERIARRRLRANSSKTIADLAAAVIYMKSDGTQKQCGDRCAMHIEDGVNKNRCLIFGEDVIVPNKASCCFYVKGPAATSDSKFLVSMSTDVGGLVLGEVTCKNCIRANEDVSVCNFLTAILKKVWNVDTEFKIEPDACCNAQQSKIVLENR